MCTCCQNWTNTVSANSLTRSGCNSGNIRTGCGCTGCGGNTRTGCGCTGCGGNTRTGCGCTGCGGNTRTGCGCTSCGGNTRTGCNNGCGSRYISFPISGTAVVPTSSIYFYPTSWGNSSGCFGAQTTSGCFGRCGGSTAIANYYEDYYARQYGLND